MDKAEKIMACVTGFLVLFIILLTIFLTIDIVTSGGCAYKYENVKHNPISGCMVEYNGKYIPEDLYEKAYVQNINITNAKDLTK